MLVHVQIRPGNRSPAVVKTTAETADRRRAIAVLGHVLLARPDQFHGAADGLGDLRGLLRIVGVDTAAEASAEVAVVDGDVVRFEFQDIGHGGAHAEGIL